MQTRDDTEFEVVAKESLKGSLREFEGVANSREPGVVDFICNWGHARYPKEPGVQIHKAPALFLTSMRFPGVPTKFKYDW